MVRRRHFYMEIFVQIMDAGAEGKKTILEALEVQGGKEEIRGGNPFAGTVGQKTC